MIIMETHVQFHRIAPFWANVGYQAIAIMEANGHVGGLWVLMQTGLRYAITILDTDAHSITFQIASSDSQWVCTGIYASPKPALSPVLWQHLCDLSATITSPWLMIGDFNEILLPGDQCGGTYVHSRAEAFANMIDSSGMSDLPTNGG